MFGDSIREFSHNNLFSDRLSLITNLDEHRKLNNADYSLLISDGQLFNNKLKTIINNNTDNRHEFCRS